MSSDLCPLLLVAHGPTGVDGRVGRRRGHSLKLTVVGTIWGDKPADGGHEEVLMSLAPTQSGDGVGHTVTSLARLWSSEG